MDLEQLSGLEITQADRNKALTDALQTRNPLLIRFALEIGAEPKKGGKRLLEYAVQQGNLELVQELVPTIADGVASAMSIALSQGHGEKQIEIVTWLLDQGAVMQIDKKCIQENTDMVQHFLRNYPKERINIQYEALEAVIYLKNHSASEVLEMLLDFLKKNSHPNLRKWLVELADYTVDTEYVDCMKVMRKYGLDLAYVNTKYCSRTMKKYLEENGIKVGH